MRPQPHTRRLPAILALALLLTLPATAGATEIPTHGRYIRSLNTVGQKFWKQRGVTPCPTPEYFLDTELLPVSDALGATVLGSCTIWLDWATITNARINPRVRDMGLTACTVVVHELGHTAGLLHAKTGLMAPSIEEALNPPPWDCRVYVRDRAKRAKAKR